MGCYMPVPISAKHMTSNARKLMQSGNVREAAAYLLEAIKTYPTDPILYYQLGNCFERLSQNQTSQTVVQAEAALQCYEKVMSLNPDDFLSINMAAIILLRLNRIQEAERYAVKAAKLRPNDPGPVLVMSRVMSAYGHHYDAERYKAMAKRLSWASRSSVKKRSSLAKFHP